MRWDTQPIHSKGIDEVSILGERRGEIYFTKENCGARSYGFRGAPLDDQCERADGEPPAYARPKNPLWDLEKQRFMIARLPETIRDQRVF